MATSSGGSISKLIKAKALELNFDICGITAARPLSEHAGVIESWCSSGFNGGMNYLCRDVDKRTDPSLLFPGARSIIVTGLNYYTGKIQKTNNVPLISRYAYGSDYHDVIINKLNLLIEYIRSFNPNADGKAFVDNAPLLEKAWAREAGLGWPGRHSVLINREIGSFFFLGVVIMNIELEYDEPFNKDLCASCSLCLDACPTGAINENRTIDARRCISYLTVESKSEIPDELVPKMEGRVFGCDRCQEVCPWNKYAKNHKIPDFDMQEEIASMTGTEWKNLIRGKFLRLFSGSAIARRGYEMFMKNVTNVTKYQSPD